MFGGLCGGWKLTHTTNIFQMEPVMWFNGKATTMPMMRMYEKDLLRRPLSLSLSTIKEGRLGLYFMVCYSFVCDLSVFVFFSKMSMHIYTWRVKLFY